MDNAAVRSVPAALSRLAAAPWRPGEELSLLTFAINYRINEKLGRPGLDVTGLLIPNVLLHALNACLVYHVLRSLRTFYSAAPTAGAGPLFLSAALFAVHPLHATSVVYTLQRRGLLATAFSLLCVLAWLRFRRPTGPARRWSALLLAPCCFVLAVKSKSMALTLPLAVLSVELCRLLAAGRLSRRAILGLSAAAAGSVLLLLCFAYQQGLVDLTGGRIVPYGEVYRGLNAWTHLLTEARAFLHYWKLLLLPIPGWLCLDHDLAPSYGLLDGSAGLALAVHGAILTAALLIARRGRPMPACGLLWFYAALIPYAVLPQSELLVEYKTYLPAVGAAMLSAAAVERLRARAGSRVAWTVAGAAATVLTAVTLHRNTVFRDPVRIWEDVVRKYPASDRGCNNLATALSRRGRWPEACEYYRRAVQISPGHGPYLHNFAVALVECGRLEEGIEHYRRIIARDPASFAAQYELGRVLARTGDFASAVEHFNEAAALRPGDYSAHYDLATALVRSGRRDEAIPAYRRALQIRPDDPQARTALQRLGASP
jgi:tetratricopeptide (TPR) repeat protein